MAKFIKCEDHDWQGVYLFRCPGCGCAHYVNTIKGEMGNPCWQFNGNVDRPALYDYVYVANMGKADYLKSSIPDEAHLALYIKDTIDDPDAPDGATMRRWYATMIAAGEPIEWDEVL